MSIPPLRKLEAPPWNNISGQTITAEFAEHGEDQLQSVSLAREDGCLTISTVDFAKQGHSIVVEKAEPTAVYAAA
jgi:hypothetical protein